MTVGVSFFDSVQVIHAFVSNVQALYFVTGTGVVFFHGTQVNDWTRDTLSFLVPGAGSNQPTPLDFGGNAVNGVTVNVFPATMEYFGTGENAGWGIDNAVAFREGDNIRVEARIVARGTTTIMTRVGFAVQIWATEP